MVGLICQMVKFLPNLRSRPIFVSFFLNFALKRLYVLHEQYLFRWKRPIKKSQISFCAPISGNVWFIIVNHKLWFFVHNFRFLWKRNLSSKNSIIIRDILCSQKLIERAIRDFFSKICFNFFFFNFFTKFSTIYFFYKFPTNY